MKNVQKDGIKYLSIKKKIKNCDMLAVSLVIYWPIGQLMLITALRLAAA